MNKVVEPVATATLKEVEAAEEEFAEAGRVLDEAAESHAYVRGRLVSTTVAMQKALLNYSAAHNALQIALRQTTSSDATRSGS